jgi:hypothetical protein
MVERQGRDHSESLKSGKRRPRSSRKHFERSTKAAALDAAPQHLAVRPQKSRQKPSGALRRTEQVGDLAQSSEFIDFLVVSRGDLFTMFDAIGQDAHYEGS